MDKEATRDKLKKSWVAKRQILLLKSKGIQVTKENRDAMISMLKKTDAKLELPATKED